MGSYGKTLICFIKFLHTLFIRQTHCSEILIHGFHQIAYNENYYEDNSYTQFSFYRQKKCNFILCTVYKTVTGGKLIKKQ